MSPYLFAIFINDLFDEAFTSYTAGYADDFSFFSKKNSVDLESYINTLYQCATLNKLKINYEKVVTLKLDSNEPDEALNVLGIFFVTVYRNLGLYVDNKLCFNKLIQYVYSKSNLLLRLYIKLFKPTSPSFFRQFFLYYILPIIDYACVIYRAHYLYDI